MKKHFFFSLSLNCLQRNGSLSTCSRVISRPHQQSLLKKKKISCLSQYFLLSQCLTVTRSPPKLVSSGFFVVITLDLNQVEYGVRWYLLLRISTCQRGNSCNLREVNQSQHLFFSTSGGQRQLMALVKTGRCFASSVGHPRPGTGPTAPDHANVTAALQHLQ